MGNKQGQVEQSKLTGAPVISGRVSSGSRVSRHRGKDDTRHVHAVDTGKFHAVERGTWLKSKPITIPLRDGGKSLFK